MNHRLNVLLLTAVLGAASLCLVPLSWAEGPALSPAMRRDLEAYLEGKEGKSLTGVIDLSVREAPGLVLPDGKRIPFEGVALEHAITPWSDGMPATGTVGAKVEGKRTLDGLTYPSLSLVARIKRDFDVLGGSEKPWAASLALAVDSQPFSSGTADVDPVKKLDRVAYDFEQAQDFLLSASRALEEGAGAALTAGEQDEIRERICTAVATLDLDRKAIYRRIDNYAPDVYREIHANCRSVVAISRKGHSPSGSGSLVGTDLVMTCLHCVSEHEPNQLEVWFDYERNGNVSKQTRVFPVEKVVFRGKPYGSYQRPVDFALLAIGRDSDGMRPSDYKEVDGKRATYPPLPLAAAEPVRDDAIYVIGHPGGSVKTVHDNAFVLFPFSASEDGLRLLSLTVCGMLHMPGGDAPAGLPTADHDQALGELKDSYRWVEGSDPKRFKNFSTRRGGHPTIGADCDTFQGNSGSPAFSRLSNSIIGILYAGEPDTRYPHSAGWRRHECIVPISVVIEQLNREQSDWITAYGVSIR